MPSRSSRAVHAPLPLGAPSRRHRGLPGGTRVIGRGSETRARDAREYPEVRRSTGAVEAIGRGRDTDPRGRADPPADAAFGLEPGESTALYFDAVCESAPRAALQADVLCAP